jgi:hypothetical protein
MNHQNKTDQPIHSSKDSTVHFSVACLVGGGKKKKKGGGGGGGGGWKGGMFTLISHIGFYSTFTLISGALTCIEVNWKW